MKKRILDWLFEGVEPEDRKYEVRTALVALATFLAIVSLAARVAG